MMERRKRDSILPPLLYSPPPFFLFLRCPMRRHVQREEYLLLDFQGETLDARDKVMIVDREFRPGFFHYCRPFVLEKRLILLLGFFRSRSCILLLSLANESPVYHDGSHLSAVKFKTQH